MAHTIRIQIEGSGGNKDVRVLEYIMDCLERRGAHVECRLDQDCEKDRDCPGVYDLDGVQVVIDI